jgi:uncharacterized coiled-coil protein SlyX
MTCEQSRLTELELRYMTLARTVEELSDVLADQRQTIGMLVRELRDVTGRMKHAEGPVFEKPPHY